jgi:UDP-glucose 4-epimerase
VSNNAPVRRTLITGGAGFIGSHLADTLLDAGHEVWILDDLSTGRIQNLDGVRDHSRLHVVVDSVLHPAIVNELVYKCDEVYHLAAAVGVQLIVDSPVHTISTNINGTEVVLDYCGRFGKRVLIASTSEVYGDRRERVALAEDDQRIYGPTSVARWAYAASKEIDEFLALAQHRERGLDCVIARLFNTVGPRQRGDYGMVVPRFVTRALAGRPIEIYGTGEQSRCFCDVADTVRALRLLMETDGTSGRVFNVGSPRSVTMNELAVLVRDRCGSSSEIVRISYDDAYGPGFEDMLHRQPDTTRIRNATGWQPEIELEQTIDRVAADVRTDPVAGVA